MSLTPMIAGTRGGRPRNKRAPSAIGVLILRSRLAAGLNQTDLAAKAGVSPHSVTSIECGDGQPSVRVLRKLADALGCELVIELKGRT